MSQVATAEAAVKPACLICNQPAAEYMKNLPVRERQETFSVFRCSECKLGFTVPQPKDVAPYYANNQGGSAADFITKRRLRIVNKSVGGTHEGAALLDVGCGAGHFMLGARRQGWKVAGVELNPEPARASGLEVFESVKSVQGRGPFRCITLWHSLEHFSNPLTTISKVADSLQAGGAMIVAVPNAQGWQAQLFRSKWLHLDIPRHLFHFSPASLRAILKHVGLDVVRTWHQELEYDIFGWSLSARRALSNRESIFLTDRLDLSPQAMADAVLTMGLSLLSLPLVVTGSLAGRGGTVVMAARKAA